MKKLLKISFISCFLLISGMIDAQVLITLLFGEKLNTPKIEFGLIGGLNRAFINDRSDSKGLNQFNLGFYFHFQVKNNSYISTGVLVKSSVGATGMPTYEIGDAEFDSIYHDGTLTKKINYFYVPIMFHQRFNNLWYIEAGTQLGLRNKATDIFYLEGLGGELKYTTDVKDEYLHLDAGLIGGVGFKFKKVPKSMSVGVNYYYGLVNVSNIQDVTIKNSCIYFYMKIPIGLGKAPADK